MSHFDATQQDAIRRSNRPMELAGVSMVTVLEDLFDISDGLTSGSTAQGADIDSLALGGGAFTVATDTTVGLTLGYQAGRFHNGKALVSVAAGTIALAPSTTNYVEVDRAGALHTNTVGFTSGRLPLYTVVTGVSTITGWTSAKPLMTLIGLAAVDGTMLTAAGGTKELSGQLGTINATTSFAFNCPATAATLAAAVFSSSAAIAASDTDYWTWTLTNLGPSGSGTTVMLAGAAANTTKLTGGTALTANVARSLSLTGTGTDLVTAANDRLVLTMTKTGSPADLTLSAVRLDFAFTQ